MQRAARKAGRANLAYWTRGLARTPDGEIPPPPEEPMAKLFPEHEWEPGDYYTDGSGGAHSRTPALRRAGFAAVALPDDLIKNGAFDLTPPRWLMGQVGGKQTVNRAELQAVIELLQQIRPTDRGWTTVYSDSAYVVRGASLPRGALLIGGNGDLWLEWAKQHRRHRG